MIPREIVKRAIKFNNPERLPMDLINFHEDMLWLNSGLLPDKRYSKGVDEWGCVWNNIGVCRLGEVIDFPIKEWSDFDKMEIPDITLAKRWERLDAFDKSKTDKYVISLGMSLYERCHFLRGLEEFWVDLYENPDEVEKLLDVLVDMNLYTIEKFAKAGSDGITFTDDWGLQNSLMVNPKLFKKFFKPRYEKLFKRTHELGMDTLMHSCGYIVEILDDLIEIGLDVVQMDQQANMGLDLLQERFAGRIAFWVPTDIQLIMATNDEKTIRDYANEMVTKLSVPYKGGVIVKMYEDPEAVGHSKASVDIQNDEFYKISKKWEKKELI